MTQRHVQLRYEGGVLHTRLLAATALAVALLVPGVAFADDDGDNDGGSGGGRDYVAGAGASPGFNPMFTFVYDFSAESGPLGENASGYFERRYTGPTGGVFTGTVTCLNVVGNTASFGGYGRGLTESEQSPFLVYVIDGDATNPATPDQISAIHRFGPGETVTAGFPAVCPPPASPFGYFPLTEGDLVVHDGHPGSGDDDEDEDEDEDDDDD